MMHWTSIVNEVSNYISNESARSVRKNGVTPRNGEEALVLETIRGLSPLDLWPRLLMFEKYKCDFALYSHNHSLWT